ncbi:MAG: hypothetical protein K6B67_09865 [Lachnospiraceae bacterium]|nr:hypothetical protein [Lachnospiraceae bacterium]
MNKRSNNPKEDLTQPNNSGSDSNKVAIFLASIPDKIYTFSYSLSIIAIILSQYISYKNGTGLFYMINQPLLFVGQIILLILGAIILGLITTLILGFIWKMFKK